MHKSNYDKASEVAMGKLRPKPDVSITISMKGGGGLSSLGEFPIIRRFMGSYTDEMAGVEPDMYGTATPGMTYTEDDFTPPPEGPATGGLDSTDVKAYEEQFKEVAKDRDKDAIANTLKQNVQPFRRNYMPVRTFLPPSKYNPMFNPTAGRNTLGMLTAGQTKDKFEDNEEWQLMDQSSEKQDLIKDTKEYLDQLEEVSANKFTSTWGRAKDLANNPQAASNFLSAVLNPSSNFYGIDALDIELPDSLVQEANKAREIGQRKGGGGLSSMSPRMNIGGKPYRLSYIDPRQAKVGGPIIRRQFGGDTYGEATPDMDYTEDDFTSYADIPGSQLPDTEDAVDTSLQAEQAEEGSGFFGEDTPEMPTDFPVSPRATFQQDPNAQHNIDNLTATRPVDDGSEKDFMGRTKDQSAWDQAFTEFLESGMSWEDANKAMSAGLAAPGGIESLRGFGGMGGLLNARRQSLKKQLGLQSILEGEKTRKEMEEETGILVDEPRSTLEKFNLGKVGDFVKGSIMGPDDLTDEAIEEINSKLAGSGTFYPVTMMDKMVSSGAKFLMPGPSGTIATLAGALVGGRTIGTIRMNDGKSYYVGEDGQISDMEIAQGPNLGNEPAPKRKRKPTTKTKTTTEDIVEEEKTTPIEGEKRLASLGGLQDIFRQSFGRPFRTT